MMKKILIIISFLFIAFEVSGCKFNKEEGASSNLLSESISYIEKTNISDIWEYEITNDIVKITKCRDYGLYIIVPEQIDGKNVKMIGEEAFYQHTDTISIMLPQNLKIIEGGAFYRCYSLAKIYIPESVNKIGSNPFFRCSSLTAITVASDNPFYTDINGVLFNKDKTELIVYPEGNLLENYTIPESVIKIPNDAFGYHCYNLKKLTIPSTVTDFPDCNMFIYPNEITLIVKKNSKAEEYAIKYGVNYIIQ